MTTLYFAIENALVVLTMESGQARSEPAESCLYRRKGDSPWQELRDRLDATVQFWPPTQKNRELSSRFGSVICFIQLTAARVGIAWI
jgi:hypothetical protein